MKKILIIEDNDDIRENIDEILSLSGYITRAAINGKEGLKCINDFGPDLILCDIMMPEIDGYGVLKILNSNPIWASIPLIFLTAKSDKVDFRKGMSLGASDYITKPFDDLDLLSSIEMRLKRGQTIYGSSSSPISNQFEVIPHDYILKKCEELTNKSEVRQFKRKDIIIREGQMPRYVYLLKEGKAKAYRSSEQAKDLITRLVCPNEFFGILDVLNHKTYSKTVEVIEDALVNLIPAKDFMDLVFADSAFALSLLRHKAAYTTIIENRLLDLAYNSVRKKCANALIYYAKSCPDDHQFSATREDLASIAGVAKESLIRTLSDFKNEGLIEITPSQIIMKNFNGLVNLIQ